MGNVSPYFIPAVTSIPQPASPHFCTAPLLLPRTTNSPMIIITTSKFKHYANISLFTVPTNLHSMMSVTITYSL